VAAVAEINLALCQQEPRDGRLVNRVAVGADDIAERVRRAADVGAAHRLGMAAQAVVEDLVLGQFGESDYRGLAAPRLNVRLARPMAAFTSGSVGRFFSGSDALIVRVLVKVSPDVRMAGAANVAAYVGGALSGQRTDASEQHRD